MPAKQKQTIKSQRPSKKPKDYNKLPKKVSEKEFNQYFLPFLSLPKRSRKPKLPLWKVFNYILYQMDTGCQWDKLPIRVDPITLKSEIHYTCVWRWFDRWSNDKSFERAFINSVKLLKDKKKLKLRRVHGDGTNSVAKKGAKT